MSEEVLTYTEQQGGVDRVLNGVTLIAEAVLGFFNLIRGKLGCRWLTCEQGFEGGYGASSDVEEVERERRRRLWPLF